MITISAKKREGKRSEALPAVLYGPETKNQPIEVNLRDFKKVFEKAGESSLLSLELEGKKFFVLVHETQKDPVSQEFIHVDFYQPNLTKEVEVKVPLVFEGEPPAVKDLSGTLVKEFQEVEVSALPQDLPHEIKVNVESLKTFEDEILIKDLELPSGVKVLKDPETIIAVVLPPQKVEEELEKPIEEKVEDVEVIEKERKEEEAPAEETK